MVNWIKDSLVHSYRRTCYSGDYTGQSILNALLKMQKPQNSYFDNQYVTDLFIKNLF